MGCPSTRVLHGMAMATLVAALLCACKAGRDEPADDVVKNLDRMREEARTLIADETRSASLVQSIDGLQADLLGMRATFKSTLDELRAVNARPQTTRIELEQAMDRFDAQRTAARDRVIRRHFELTDHTFGAEWRTLAEHERRALQAASR